MRKTSGYNPGMTTRTGSSLESFNLDHTRVRAPYVRTAGKYTTAGGDVISKFDLRFVQPNRSEIPTGPLHTIEAALPYLREATAAGLPVSAVCRWYHRRAIHVLRTLLPDAGPLYASTWEPVYAATMVTRANWPLNPEGRRQVIREWRQIPRLIADGGVREAHRVDGAWR